VTAIHQFVPMLHRHDAVGVHTRALRDRVVAAGMPSRIYTEIPDPHTTHETRPYLEYEAECAAGDILVYQFATQSAVAEWVANRPEPLVIDYHSITPPEFFGPWDNGITRGQVEAVQQLGRMAPRARVGIAHSHFIADELRQAGCPHTVVVPVAGVPVPPEAPSADTLARLAAGRQGTGRRWLSVGRLAPNKRHEQTIAALFVARTDYDPGARLTIVGAPTVTAYARALHAYTASLGLVGAVDFVSGISDGGLAAQYRTADVLVMLSDHEGFGVPLVEAMGQGLPVVAFDGGAVGEILGGAGTLLGAKSPRRVAEAVTGLLSDPQALEGHRLAGKARFDELALADAADRLLEAALSAARAAPAVP
jgi:glycosyltransferase involved in cell wall biosynthesis